MKKVVLFSLVLCFLAGSLVVAADQEKVNKVIETLKSDVDQAQPVIPEGGDAEKLTESHQKLQAFIKEKLLPLCVNEVFVAEVTAQNDKGASLDDIKKIDEEWVNAEDELPIHEEKLGNKCAKEIVKVAQKVGAIGETFVMDNQGANVGQNGLTSDYWQGDEAKWKKSFNKGKGGVDIGGLKYDKSSGASEQKVSLPIINKDGVVIGAVCFGVKVDKL